MPSSEPRLLVSVRSAMEAEEALAGGADVIDVKEPARGALGRADDVVLAQVVACVAGRRPVSAALGELAEFTGSIPLECAFVKWGLARMGEDWEKSLDDMRSRVRPGQGVIVAYADWQCAQAPPVDDVAAYACRHSGSVLLIDTACKENRVGDRRANLLDWLPRPWLRDVIHQAHEAGVRVALAGSLGPAEIESIRPLGPDWIAVRGAACVDGDRRATISRARVRALKASLAVGSVNAAHDRSALRPSNL